MEWLPLQHGLITLRPTMGAEGITYLQEAIQLFKRHIENPRIGKARVVYKTTLYPHREEKRMQGLV